MHLVNKHDQSQHKEHIEMSEIAQVQESQGSSILKKKEEHKSHLVYRADIDGMRTIAIFVVLVFHAFPKVIPGGFVGVDIFFVISGFLISGIIIKQTQKQKFSYIDFYVRRIKRIHPALILVLFFALYIIKKLGDNFIEVGFYFGTLDASLIFGANLQILTYEKGYFDPDIHGNPLLHLWSLGVEEQFYIIWPCLLAFTLKFSKKNSLIILVFYTIVCFVSSIVAVYQNAKFAFYFPFCRFWQMSVGGILALVNFKIQDRKVNEALSAVGVIGILITVFTVNDESLFPGFWAFVPTLCAAFIIQAGNESIINSKILSSKPFVFVGKISYSLYLWHWPLLVFSRTFYPHGSTSIFANTYFILFLTVIITLLTYFIVEDPIRKSQKKWLAIILLLCMIGIGVISYNLEQRVNSYQSFQLSDQQFIDLYKNLDSQYEPGPKDFYQKDGKSHPNFSINKERLEPNGVKTTAPLIWNKHQKLVQGAIILQKKAFPGSKYYDERFPNNDLKSENFLQVSNEGRQNQFFVVGDSHAQSVAYRFQKLYEQAKEKGKEQSFPTVVTIITRGMPLIQGNFILNVTRHHVDKFKPKRILLGTNWPMDVCKDNCMDWWQFKPHECDLKKFDRYLNEFMNFAKQIRNKGVEVHILGINIDLAQLQPTSIYDSTGLVQINTRPFKYSDYRRKYGSVIDKFEAALKQANFPMIELADNFCWEDQCFPTSSKGYPAYIDCMHFSQFYSRNWLSSLDHLVQF